MQIPEAISVAVAPTRWSFARPFFLLGTWAFSFGPFRLSVTWPAGDD